MKVEEFNQGRSLKMPGFSYGCLCKYISRIPSVAFTRRRRFFWWTNNVGAEFNLGGHGFKIETDQWDGALWILSKDGCEHLLEFKEMKDHFEKLGIKVITKDQTRPKDVSNPAPPDTRA